MFACGLASKLCFLWSFCEWVFVLHHVFVEFVIIFLCGYYGFGPVDGVSVNGCPPEPDFCIEFYVVDIFLGFLMDNSFKSWSFCDWAIVVSSYFLILINLLSFCFPQPGLWINLEIF